MEEMGGGRKPGGIILGGIGGGMLRVVTGVMECMTLGSGTVADRPERRT